MQERLIPKTEIKYNYGPYNMIKGEQQWIRLSQGCPHQCPWCYEPREYEIYSIPDIVKHKVGIIDMNLLAKPEALQILKDLPINNGKVIEYEFVCGVDYRFLTKEIAEETTSRA
jgi:pyruvate-formate lyase-activating enzyme